MTDWHEDIKVEAWVPIHDAFEGSSRLGVPQGQLRLCMQLKHSQLFPCPILLSLPSSYWSWQYSGTQICLRVCCLGKWLMILAQSQKANERSKWNLVHTCQHNSTIIKWAEETKWRAKDLQSNIINNILKIVTMPHLWIRKNWNRIST